MVEHQNLRISDYVYCIKELIGDSDNNWIADIMERLFFRILRKQLKREFPIGSKVIMYKGDTPIEIKHHNLSVESRDSGDCGTTGYVYSVWYEDKIELWRGGLTPDSSRTFAQLVKEDSLTYEI